jgi:hypothetical protein
VSDSGGCGGGGRWKVRGGGLGLSNGFCEVVEKGLQLGGSGGLAGGGFEFACSGGDLGEAVRATGAGKAVSEGTEFREALLGEAVCHDSEGGGEALEEAGGEVAEDGVVLGRRGGRSRGS